MAFGMDAQNFNDSFRVVYNGEEVADGSTIIVNQAEYQPWDEWEMAEVLIKVENKLDEIGYITASLDEVAPSRSEFTSDFTKWGIVSLCFNNAATLPGNCLGSFSAASYGEGCVDIPAAGSANVFEWQIHRTGMENPEVVSEFVLNMDMITDLDDKEVIPDTRFSINVKYGTNLSGVHAVGAATAHSEYFSIDGRRLEGPAQGLYIVKTGSQIEKRIGR